MAKEITQKRDLMSGNISMTKNRRFEDEGKSRELELSIEVDKLGKSLKNTYIIYRDIYP